VRQQGVPPSHIIVYGHSLGASVAIDLSAREPVGALIVEGALVSIPARGQEMYPWLPVSLIATNRFDSSQKIRSVQCPKLIMHARDDEMVPIHHGLALFKAASEPKEFVELKGGHGDAIEVDRSHIALTIAGFAERVVPSQPQPVSQTQRSTSRRLDRRRIRAGKAAVQPGQTEKIERVTSRSP